MEREGRERMGCDHVTLTPRRFVNVACRRAGDTAASMHTAAAGGVVCMGGQRTVHPASSQPAISRAGSRAGNWLQGPIDCVCTAFRPSEELRQRGTEEYTVIC